MELLINPDYLNPMLKTLTDENNELREEVRALCYPLRIRVWGGGEECTLSPYRGKILTFSLASKPGVEPELLALPVVFF